mgnify:CR=1 FL=1
MSEVILAALITSVLTFAGVLVTSRSNNNKIVTDIKLEVTKNQAVTDTKIEELTREVREHNNFAKRMPVVEEQIKVANHRISDLEKSLKN